ncbi:HNH endonuclease [Cohnella candidum]|uniref:HNH endonuclease n=1 Tax=Cohnella candidum TaxID=2674991 RepID=A0A3G3K1B2_9BACL|nr:HNH endonuclease [Cohnella candidum]AYQ74296.1 HNH endonuclease [Cohnella candidum]
MTHSDKGLHKACSACGEMKPLDDFPRRTGRKAGQQARRGTCKSCMRRKRRVPAAATAAPEPRVHPAPKPRSGMPKHPPRPTAATRKRQPESAGHAIADPTDASALVPTRQGFIRMRGRTDKGRRWFQEIDLPLAVTLVKERAAVVVNRHTIRRLFSNKDFRRYILTRDKHTCHYCGQYGDTIDHLLPRAKGGHTTPDNCVCACNECNQSKADRDLEEFVGARAGG